MTPRRLSVGAAGLVIAVAAALLVGNSGDDGDSGAITDFDPATTVESTQAAAGAIGGEEGAAIADTLALVDAGGPFPHDQDGATFQNREGLLPSAPTGHYREYTVPTPGSRDRGARRIVTGGDPPRAYYYTEDHYRTFRPFTPEPR